MEKAKIEERVLLFLFCLGRRSAQVNINTFKRYLYLYYMSAKFLKKDEDNITISLNKSEVNIPFFDSIIIDLEWRELIVVKENTLIIENSLMELVEKLLENKQGRFFELYKETNPYINLLSTYDDQFVFTIFFSEPTFVEASKRNENKVYTESSVLVALLSKFKNKIRNDKIDEYDVLTYWMDYILKNYYTIAEEENTNE